VFTQRVGVGREPVGVEVGEFVEPVVAALVRDVAVEPRGRADHVHEPVGERGGEPFVFAVVEHHRPRADPPGSVHRRRVDLTDDHIRPSLAGEFGHPAAPFDEFFDPRQRPRTRAGGDDVRQVERVEQRRRHVLLPRRDGHLVALVLERRRRRGEQVDERRVGDVEHDSHGFHPGSEPRWSAVRSRSPNRSRESRHRKVRSSNSETRVA
jgi:hypothetical protein